MNMHGKKCTLCSFSNEDYFSIVPFDEKSRRFCNNGIYFNCEGANRYRIILSADILFWFDTDDKDCITDFYYKTNMVINSNEVADLIEEYNSNQFRLIFGEEAEFVPDYQVCFNVPKAIEDLKPFLESEDESVRLSALAFADFLQRIPEGLEKELPEYNFDGIF